MSQNVFLAALQKITAGQLSVAELITAATQLVAAGQAASAEQLYQVWVRCNPGHPNTQVALFNCSVLQNDRGDLEGAITALKAAIAADPVFIPAYINLGGLLERGGGADQGVALWKTAVDKLPSVTGQNASWKVTTLKQIGRVLSDQQRLEGAEVVLREALSIDRTQREAMEHFVALRMTQCKWPVVAPFEGVDARAQVAGIAPLSMACYTDDPLLQLANAARYAAQVVDETADLSLNDRRHAPIDLEGRRLRVGYVSSDLRDHAIGYLMAEMFELHDREKVEVFAYYCGRPANEGLNLRLREAIEHWVDITPMSDDEAAARIAADGIDILVDVNGFTRDARSAVFARRPAPVQVNWLGFPSTMGSPYHHYVIADDWIIPPESELYYTEKVLRLPCYQPNDRRRAVAEARPTRAQAGLPDDAVVFCCFNGTQKISRPTFARWLEILNGVPNSVLWLLDPGAETAARLREQMAAAGVHPARLIIAPKLANAHHLARYPLADLFLDTFPYGAHTTCSDALWMGVPIVTLSGRSFASRVCGSLIRAAGLPELVCETPEAFVATAVALGNDPAAIAALKQRLEAGRDSCDLFNMDQLVARLEDLYRGMAEAHARGETPQPDLTNLDAYLAIGLSQDHEGCEMLTRPDYHEVYKAGLAKRHAARPLAADGRLWTAADIAATEPRPAPARTRAAEPRKRAAA